MSTLYIVATPIGNLEDISYRAVRLLGESDVIAAEDTRQTRKLLNRYGIRPDKLISCRAHNEADSAKGIVKLLDQGHTLSYVSDAGTPGISDPGGLLALAVYDAGHNVVPVPGTSALTALISVSGMASRGFIFNGFLSPRPGRRRKRLSELLDSAMAFVLYESPYRIVKLIEELNNFDPTLNLFIGREITKIHEEFIRGNPVEVLARLSSRNTIQGEFAVLVGKGKN